MLKYVLKRVVAAVLTILVLITIVFFLVRLMPGEPFTSAHAVCFACIWAGAALVIAAAIRKQVRQR